MFNDSPFALKYGINPEAVTIEIVVNNSISFDTNLILTTAHINNSPILSIVESKSAPFFDSAFRVLANGPSKPSIALPRNINNKPISEFDVKNEYEPRIIVNNPITDKTFGFIFKKIHILINGIANFSDKVLKYFSRIYKIFCKYFRNKLLTI